MLEAWVQFDLGSFSPGARPIKLRVVLPRVAPLALDVRITYAPRPPLPPADSRRGYRCMSCADQSGSRPLLSPP